MAVIDPVAELHSQFSSDDALPTPWAVAREHLEKAEIFWITTVRPDGRPHVVPLMSVWLDGALYFCTDAGERKAKNLAQNAHCVLTTGRNALAEGLDLVVEGEAAKVSDEAELRSVADTYESKYGPHFTAPRVLFSVSVTPSDAVTLWCTGLLPQQRSVSVRGRSARPAGASRRSSRTG